MSVSVKTQSGEFLAWIDTGSDHTLVPEKYAAGFVFMRKGAIWTFSGSAQHRFYKGELELMGKKLRVEDVLLADGDVGILGLDVLEHFEVLVKRGKATIKPI